MMPKIITKGYLCENNPSILEAMRKAAPLHRGQVTFIAVKKDQDRLLTYLNSTSDDFPSAHMTTMRHYINHYWKFDREDLEILLHIQILFKEQWQENWNLICFK